MSLQCSFLQRLGRLSLLVVVWLAIPASTRAATKDPADWFLSAIEISGESCGRDREADVQHAGSDYPGLAAWTSNNRVTFIPDGKTLFGLIKKEVDAAKAGDQVFGAGWTFASTSEMQPPDHVSTYYDCMDDHSFDGICKTLGVCSLAGYPFAQNKDKDHICCKDAADPQCTSVEGVFARANARGATIRMLHWNNAVPGTNGGTLLKYSAGLLNERFFGASEAAASKDSLVVLDARQVDGLSSIHQKFYSVLPAGRPPISFVGGIDLGNCRMDKSDAKPGAGWTDRRLSIIEQCSGWLDQAVRIEGPGAADVANTFVQRWNWKGDLVADQFHPSTDEFKKRWATTLPKVINSSAPFTAAEFDAGHRNQHVQVLRTYACNQIGPYAPGGEFTVMAALLKVISNAQRYIFIEDQYGFSMDPLRDALQAAQRRGVFIVAVLNMYGAELPSIHCKGSGGTMWNCLRQDGAAVFEYNMEVYGDYVHAKTWMVDDCWFMTGSANINWRSMTNDEELSVAVMDHSCQNFSHDGNHEWNFVKKARCRMWAEVSSVEGRTAAEICNFKDESAADVGSLVQAIFGTAYAPTASKLLPLGTYVGGAEDFSNWACGLTDPDGSCKAEPFYLMHKSFSTDSKTYGDEGSKFCPSGKSKEYRIAVQTANGFLQGFGTDSDMDIRITGTTGSTGWARLNRLHGGWNFFEDGDKDVLTLQACDVGVPSKIELDFYDNHPGSDWCLEYIEVRGCGRWKFRNWLHHDTRLQAIKPSFECDPSSLDGSGDYAGADKDVVDHSCSGVPYVSDRQCSNTKQLASSQEDFLKQILGSVSRAKRTVIGVVFASALVLQLLQSLV